MTNCRWWVIGVSLAASVLGAGFVYGGWLRPFHFVFPSAALGVAGVALVQGIRLSPADRPVTRVRGGLALSGLCLLLFFLPVVAKRLGTEWAVRQLPLPVDARTLFVAHGVSYGDGSPNYMVAFETRRGVGDVARFLGGELRKRGWQVAGIDFNADLPPGTYTIHAERGEERLLCSLDGLNFAETTVVHFQNGDPRDRPLFVDLFR